MNMIILTERDQIENNYFKLLDHRFLHIKNILKKQIGETIEAGVLNQYKGKAEIIDISDTSVIICFCEKYLNESSNISIDIICALPRPQTIKKILPLIATTGVKNLHLIKSNRVEKSFFHSPLVNENAKMEKYLLEGLSQGKRCSLPSVEVYKKFKSYFDTGFVELIKDLKPSEFELIILHPNQDENLYNVIKNKKVKNLIVAIGPEGGWVPFEIEYFEKQGFKKVCLGSSILRVENALNSVIAQKELLEMVFDKTEI